MKKILVILSFMFLFWNAFAIKGVYNIHSVSYSYWCRWSDSWWDHCWPGEITIVTSRSSARAGSYRCWKIDNDAPIITVNGINPLTDDVNNPKWVNIEGYNPIKDLKITIRDSWAGLEKVIITIWTKTKEVFFNKNSSVSYDYNKICNLFKNT